MLPLPGGMFDQEDRHIRYLLGIYNILDQYRKEEMEKPTRTDDQTYSGTRLKSE